MQCWRNGLGECPQDHYDLPIRVQYEKHVNSHITYIIEYWLTAGIREVAVHRPDQKFLFPLEAKLQPSSAPRPQGLFTASY